MERQNTVKGHLKKVKVAFFIMLLSSGLVSAFVCHDDDIKYDSDVVMEIADVTLDYPVNGSTIGSPVQYSLTTSVCHMYGAVGLVLNTTQGTTQYLNTTYSARSDTNINTTKLFSQTLTDGNYNYTSRVSYGQYNVITPPVLSFTTPVSANYFTVLSTSNTGENTGGSCLTEYGYRLSGLAEAGSDYVTVDLTGLSEYCVDTDCNNTFVIGGGYYVDGDYQILINTTLYKPWTLYIGGFNYNFNNVRVSKTQDETITPTLDDFTRQNKAYWVNILNETNGDKLLVGADQNALTLKIVCEAYSPDTIDLKTDNNNPYFIVSKEIPTLWLQATYKNKRWVTTTVQELVGYNSTFNPVTNVTNSYNIYQNRTTTVYTNVTDLVDRKYQPSSQNGTVSLYMIQNNTKYSTLSFILSDYTSQYSDSYLELYRNVNGSLVPVWRTKWTSLNYQSYIEGIDLQNGSDYQVVVSIPNKATNNFGWFIPEADETRTIVITNPTLAGGTNHYDGINWGLINEPLATRLGMWYNVTDPRVTEVEINFSVKNMTHVIYSVTSTTPSGVLTYTVPNENDTYFYGFTAEVPYHSSFNFFEMITFAGQTTRRLREAFELENIFGVGGNFLGISLPSMETGIVYISVMFVALLAGAANWTMVLGLVGLVTGFFYMVGYIQGYAPLIVAVFAIAALGKIAMGRSKEGSD